MAPRATNVDITRLIAPPLKEESKSKSLANFTLQLRVKEIFCNRKHTRTNVKRSDQENRSSCSLATIMALVHGRVNPIDIMSPAFAGWNDIESSKYQDQNADNDVYHEPRGF